MYDLYHDSNVNYIVPSSKPEECLHSIAANSIYMPLKIVDNTPFKFDFIPKNISRRA